jgi:hypothetical protein
MATIRSSRSGRPMAPAYDRIRHELSLERRGVGASFGRDQVAASPQGSGSGTTAEASTPGPG